MSVSFIIGDDYRNYLNLSNMNAAAMCEIMGISLSTVDGYVGGLPPNKIPAVLERIERLLAPGANLSWAVRADEQSNDGRLFIQGIDEAYIRERLAQFQALFRRALASNLPVHWG